MLHNLTIERSRHYFRNCKAAFRLLQGALLSGNHRVTEDQLKLLENKFIDLENKFEKANPRRYNPGDPTFDDVQHFFLTVNGSRLDSRVSEELDSNTKPLAITKKILVIDDQYEKSGWKEVFEFLFGNNVVGICKYDEAISITNKPLNYLAILIDLKIPAEKRVRHKYLGKEGFRIIKLISAHSQHIPLIAFSAYDSAIMAKKAFEDGAWDYFVKEPGGEESNQFKNSVDYYSEFIEIINGYIKYDTEYSGYWNRIGFLEQLLTAKIPDDFKNVIVNNLRMAYKYLIMDDALRFNPRFLEIDKYEEVIFQSAKALDTFFAYLLNKYSITPEKMIEDGRTSYDAATLGSKIYLIKKNRKMMGIKWEWCEEARSLNKHRNENTHQDQFYYADINDKTGEEILVSDPRFIIKKTSVSGDFAMNFFMKVISQIETALGTLPNLTAPDVLKKPS